MNIKYYEDKKIEKNVKSIFLAGPTPRSEDIKSWRPEAIKILNELNFDGNVYVPEMSGKGKNGEGLNYKEIISWELEHLARADIICIWLPRDLKDMPAFTTNVEFGYHLKTGKVIYGRPNNAPKTRYLDFLYEKEYGKKPCESLEEVLREAAKVLKDKPEQIFFTSDTHFGSDRTRNLSKRPFKNTIEMDEEIINNWNKIVKKKDWVYHLGDFGNYKIIEKLNGKIILILGNYEKEDLIKNYKNNFDEYKNFLISLGFKDVIRDGLELNLLGEKIFLTHEPLSCKKHIFNLFGHVHKLCMIKDFGLNVGVDNFDYCPASLDEVLFYKKAIENHYDKNVYCTKNDLN